jgi:hypothetical protein
MSCISQGSVLTISPPLLVLLFCWLCIITSWRILFVVYYDSWCAKTEHTRILGFNEIIFFLDFTFSKDLYTLVVWDRAHFKKGGIKEQPLRFVMKWRQVIFLC